jgi:tetratricopeptide (TPR) repeat protein
VPLSPQGFPLRLRRRSTRPIAARWRAGLALAACGSACLALLLAGPVAAAEVSLEASVEQNPLIVGDSTVLTLEFSGSRNVPVPDLGNLDGFSAQYLGPSTQVSIVNGQVSASVSHRFRLVAQRAGRFSLGPFRVEYEGKTYTSNRIRLRVLKQTQASTAGRNLPRPRGLDQLRLAVVPEKTEVYVGERIPIQIKLYVGNVRVDDLQYPEMNSDAIVLDKLEQPARRSEILEGRRWQTLLFDTEMTALRPGEIDIPATMAMSVLTTRRGRGNALFDQFFGQTARRQVQVRAAPVHLTVRPLPEAGRPAHFSGAVGRFDFTLSAKPTTVAVGDPVTVEMRVSGKGNLSGVEAPALPAGERFRTYDPTQVKDKDAPDRRVFEQVVIPRRADVKQLPALSFSFFDPQTGAYRTITRGPIALDVKPAAAEAAPHVFAPEQPGEAAAGPEPVGRDIVYIKDVAGRLSARGTSFFERPWFFALQLVPVALFGALLFFVRRRERFAADPSLLRFRNAGREVRRSLATIRARSSDAQQFYDGLAGALSAYLAAKLGLPPGAVERERVLACLSRNGTSADLRQKIDDFFCIIDRIRYAPGGGAEEERERALELARGIVNRLERSRSVAGRSAAGLVVVLLLSSSAAVRAGGAEAASPARPDPHTGFFRGNTAYAEGRYRDAARAYEAVLERGVESGPLHFNLGNAYFKSGQVGLAIAEYERARRLLPRDPDVRANLDYAEEVAKVPVDEPPMWQRLVFPLAFRMSAAELAVLAAALWFALWTVLAARLLLPRLGLGLRRGAWVTGVLWALIAASLAFRFSELELRREVVVTKADETAVRFEPSQSGTEHFPVTEGTLLEITERRDGWLQVRRGDGRRGWIPREAITPLRASSSRWANG